MEKKPSRSCNVNRFVRASWIFLIFVLPSSKVIAGLAEHMIATVKLHLWLSLQFGYDHVTNL